MRGGLSAFIAGLGEVESMSLRKPYRSVGEQLRILRSRGMAVDAGAGHVLRREGYYSIVNGYKDLFLDRKACLTAGDDRYGTGARFDDLYTLFLFDRELRELLFSAITRAEAALKAVCAHEFTRLHPDEVNRISIPTIMIPSAVRAPWR
ncbi:Abi family protein [Bifidobacterium angulatum]|uniref:Abi family protein n=1 Tax=Bifidobacterium angulatum TaxID=1683 RepID=UPI003AAEF294